VAETFLRYGFDLFFQAGTQISLPTNISSDLVFCERHTYGFSPKAWKGKAQNDATQSVEAFAHIARLMVQQVGVGTAQTEH